MEKEISVTQLDQILKSVPLISMTAMTGPLILDNSFIRHGFLVTFPLVLNTLKKKIGEWKVLFKEE